MARLIIPDELTSVTFQATAQTVFPISFALFGKDNLRVFVDGNELPQSSFTFSGALLEGGGYQGGTVTLTSAATGEVTIERDIRPVRASNYAPSNFVQVGAVDQALNRLTAVDQDLARRQAEDRARLEEAIEEAGDSLGNINKLDKREGLADLLNKAAGRASLESPRMITAEMYGDVLSTAANAALMAGLPFLQQAEADLIIDLTPYLASAVTDTDRYNAVKGVLSWAQKVVGPSNYRTILQLPVGLTDVGGAGSNTQNFNLSGKDGRKITFSAPQIVDFIGITSISSVPGMGTERIVTVGLSAPLPARVVPNYILGLQELVGNNDIGFFGGGVRVDTIAGDRMSFTYRRLFHVPPTDPTVLTAGGPINTRPRNSVVVPYSSFIGAWSSAAAEGMFTLRDGAQVDSRWIGWGSKDTGTQGAIVSVVGAGSRWTSLDWECWLGGGERVARGAFGGDLNFNRACIGADSRTSSSYLIETQGYATVQITRSDLGGGRSGCVSVSNGGGGYLGQNNFHGGNIACIVARQAPVLVYPGHAYGSQIGALATDGGVLMGGNGTTFLTTHRCNIGWDGKRGGRVVGPLTSDNDVSASWARADMMRDGSVYTTRDVNPTDAGRSVTLANNTFKQASLRGTVGTLLITCRSSIVSNWYAVVSGSNVVSGGSSVTIHLGSDARNSIASGTTQLADGATNLAVPAAGLPGTPINAGRHTYGIWANAGAPFLQMVNEDGGERIYDIIITGDLELGVFS
ncbi:hypothetical protein V8J38_11115 [Brevundimonas olei]|uniref:DUF1983 domain-containing protein n=1 Tax=Brevundimonas olei TaxID=657642 RepID=A0ABZ2I8A3_9CAUL